MNNIQQQKQKANMLRKQGLIEDALPVYRELCASSTRDKFDVAGYLHCLRKLKLYEEALALAEESEEKYKNFNWFRIEIIWTYIGILKMKSENTHINSILPSATKIMGLSPDDLQKNTTILLVLKKAKQFKKWDVASKWVDQIKPDTLNKEPIALEKGTTPWSSFLIWHHHKVRILLHQKKYDEAIELIASIKKESKQVSKYFRCLEAQAYEKKGQPERTLQILTDLSKNVNVDWWIVHQHANVLKNQGEKEFALLKMYDAASRSFKVEAIVALILDIALLCKELNRVEESYYHLLLYKLIREKREWAVSEEVVKLLKEMDSKIDKHKNMNYREVLHRCRTYWNSNTTIKSSQREIKSNRQMKKDLTGNLVSVKEDKPFCFINTNSNSYFCYKSDIKNEVKEGSKVKFDAVPTYDKKKQTESWKAVNIKCL